MNQAKRRLGFWMAAGLLALGGVSTAGCRGGTSAAPSTSPSTGGGGDGAAGAPVGAVGGALVPGTGLPWPPPNLLLFIGYHNSLGIQVDDKYLYWSDAAGSSFMRADKTGAGEPQEIVRCACHPLRFVADKATASLYVLNRDRVLQVDRETFVQTALPLDWDHTSGDLFADDQYIYTAMHGCAAITRFDKLSHAKEVMGISGVKYPARAGYTTLGKAGGKLVCSSPTEVYVIDTWGQGGRRVYDQGNSLWGITGVSDSAYWVDSDVVTRVGWTTVGPESVNLISKEARGRPSRLLYLPTLEKLAFASGFGIQSFSPATNQFDGFAAVGVLAQFGSSAIIDFAVDSEFAYATMSGGRTHIVNGVLQGDVASWIARVPLDALK
ncbi:MAG: hypothetical protein SFV15_15410 [Polyangiaceae bacterium]|nr:hypothetical protein [Polyangiaceae bacterium]